MKTESTIKPTTNFVFEKKGNLCEVVFFDDIKEENRIEGDEETSTQTIYIYNTYKINVFYRENLKEEIENNLSVWLEFAKNKNIEEKAAEVRNIRNKLLEESDKEMFIDRFNIEIPNNINATNLLPTVKNLFEKLANLKNNSWAIYRQKLRDLTKQEGFPFDVKFPDKPNE